MAVHQLAEPRASRVLPAALQASAARARRATVRRRRVVLSLVALAATATLVALGSGDRIAWWAVVGVLTVSGTYLWMLHRGRRIAAEMEFRFLLGSRASGVTGIGNLSASSARDAAGETLAATTGSGTARQLFALIRFLLAYAGGWLLSPIVFVLTLVVHETPRDTTSQRWLANLRAAQAHLRDQSLKTLAVSAATTASVTAAGTLGALGAPGIASASPIAASASLPAAGPLDAASHAGPVYEVVQGDTLWGIADRYSTTVAAIESLNRIRNPNFILPGLRLRLPAGAHLRTGGAWGPPALDDSRYVVRSGDSLWAIAARYGTTVSVLAATNNIRNPNLIKPGQVLIVRGGRAADPPTATRRPTGKRAPSRPTRGGHSRPKPHPHPKHHGSPSHPTPSPSGAQRAVDVALAQVGKPYQWGGAGPNSFDCSGLVMYAWENAGVDLPHYTVSQYEDTERISESELRPGDLVFYDTGDGAQPGHVTMYVGDGKIVTADTAGTRVRVEVTTWDGRPMGFGRVR
jgi:cell wall-associated NlpC family hydrolase